MKKTEFLPLIYKIYKMAETLMFPVFLWMFFDRIYSNSFRI